MYHRFGAVQFNAFTANSNPIKHAALAGKALTKTGTIPLYKPFGPSSFSSARNASRNPLGYVPSGAKIVQFRKESPRAVALLPV